MGKAHSLHAEFWVLDSLVTPQCNILCLYHPTDISNKEAEEPHCAALPLHWDIGIAQETFYRRSASHHRDIS